ncbi:MAG: NERD domain-containing protein [Chloroflexi bacterium]|nr:NERD domain-containing protein [Chloroflexota bacterium]
MFGAAIAIYFGVRLYKAWYKVQDYRLGRDGEQQVGHQFERLRKNGMEVFHDIVAENFNVDHVLISNKGIFVIETKTFRKPEKANQKIHFDGQHVFRNDRLIVPNPVLQARWNAQWLKRLLKEYTGENFKIKPVVVFPGWFVETKGNLKNNDVWALNPEQLQAFISYEPDVLNQTEINLIASHISRYILEH